MYDYSKNINTEDPTLNLTLLTWKQIAEKCTNEIVQKCTFTPKTKAMFKTHP